MSLTINHQTNDISATSGSVTIDGASAGGGAWNLISTTTVTSAVSSVDFTSLSGYEHYVAVIDDVYLATDGADLVINTLNSGSPDTTSQRYELYYGNNGTWTLSGSTSNPYVMVLWDLSPSAVSRSSCVVNIGNLHTVTRTVYYATGTSPINTSFRYGAQISSGTNYINAARGGLRFSANSGNISGGTFALYGISN